MYRIDFIGKKLKDMILRYLRFQIQERLSCIYKHIRLSCHQCIHIEFLERTVEFLFVLFTVLYLGKSFI